MPDLITHVLVVLIACELINMKKKGLILAGAILPDIVSRIFLLGFIIKLPDGFLIAVTLFHSLIPLLALAVLLATLFKDFFSAAFLIGIGAISHLLLDTFNIHFLGGIMWMFPFSWILFKYSLFIPDQFMYVAVSLLAVYIFIRVYKWRKEINDS